MKFTNEKDLSDESVRKLISELQSINKEINAIEEVISKEKQNLTYDGGKDFELSKLKIKAERINTDIINGHRQLIGKLVNQATKNFGKHNDKGKKVAPFEYAKEDLEQEAWKEFQSVLNRFDLSKESNFSNTAGFAIKCYLKRLFGYAGMKTENGDGIWAEQCLQKLVIVRQNESIIQGRQVELEEVCQFLDIPIKILNGLMTICHRVESIYAEGKGLDFVKTDFYEDGQMEDTTRYDYERREQYKWFTKEAKKHVSSKEMNVIASSYAQGDFYGITIDSLAKEFPVIKKRIEEIEDQILENQTDEGLVDSIKDFFLLRSMQAEEPCPDLLKRLGIHNN